MFRSRLRQALVNGLYFKPRWLIVRFPCRKIPLSCISSPPNSQMSHNNSQLSIDQHGVQLRFEVWGASQVLASYRCVCRRGGKLRTLLMAGALLWTREPLVSSKVGQVEPKQCINHALSSVLAQQSHVATIKMLTIISASAWVVSWTGMMSRFALPPKASSRTVVCYNSLHDCHSWHRWFDSSGWRISTLAAAATT